MLVSYTADSKIISLGDTEALESLALNVDYEALNGDGFIMKTVGKSLFIDGANDRGTLYGAYDFVEKVLGVRFLDHDAEHIPTLNEVPMYEINAVERPAFRYRTCLTDATYHVADEDFYAKMRYSHEFMTTGEEWGGNSLSLYKEFNQTHNNLTYVSPKKYYYEADGKTVIEENAHMFYVNQNRGDGNFRPLDICYSDGITEDGEIDETMEVSAAKAFLETFKRIVLESPETEYYMGGQEDITHCCSCARCTAQVEKYGVSSVNTIRFYNTMAKEIQKWADQTPELNGKKVKLVCFAYYWTKDAPVKEDGKGGYVPVHESVRPAENLYIRIADITANLYYSLVDEECVANGYGPEYLKKWSSITDRFWYWGYMTAHAIYYQYSPTLHKVQSTLYALEDIGVEYVLLQHNTTENCDWKAVMDNYVCNKLLWDPTLNPLELRNEFIRLYYGAVAKDVELLVDYCNEWVHDIIVNENSSYLGGYAHTTQHNKIETLEYILSELDRMEVMLADTYEGEELSEMRSRLREIRLMPLYLLMTNRNVYYSGNPTRYNDVAKEFFNLCTELDVTQYGEHRLVSELGVLYPYN
jgi:hypothetical protein